jgi:hypothetical protein
MVAPLGVPVVEILRCIIAAGDHEADVEALL